MNEGTPCYRWGRWRGSREPGGVSRRVADAPRPVAEPHCLDLARLRRDRLAEPHGAHERRLRQFVLRHAARAHDWAELALPREARDRELVRWLTVCGAVVAEQPVGCPEGLVGPELVLKVWQEEVLEVGREQERALLGQGVPRPRELLVVYPAASHLLPGPHGLGRRDLVMLAAHGEDGSADPRLLVEPVGLVGQAVGPEWPDRRGRQLGVLQELHHLLRATANGGEQEALPVLVTQLRAAPRVEAKLLEGTLAQAALGARLARAGVAADEEAHERGGARLLPLARKLVGDDGAEAVAPSEETALLLRPCHDIRFQVLEQRLEVRLHSLASASAAARQLHRIDLRVLRLRRHGLVGSHAGAGHAEDQQGHAAAAGRREADHTAGLRRRLVAGRSAALDRLQERSDRAVLRREEDEVWPLTKLRQDA
mmetsp:Transcript_51171/g.136800  ORF Transcript_51171/g.136800 Transcript_51171/m.136800 type:complete len:426 (+) Transcript_51171:2-1279(+)